LVVALKSQAPAVRASAAEALGAIGQLKGVEQPLRALFEDEAVDVRKAAITASGALADREAIPALLAAADAEPTRFEAIKALAAMPDILALQVYLRALGARSPELRKAGAAAIGKIRDQAAPVLDQLASRHELPPSVVPELRKIYKKMEPVMEWRIVGPFKIGDKPPFSPDGTIDLNASYTGSNEQPAVWKPTKAIDADGQVDVARLYTHLDDRAAFGYAEINSLADREVQFAVGSDDTLTVWVNGKSSYDFQQRRGFEPRKDWFDAKLVKGTNRIVTKCGNRGGGWQFSVAVSSVSDYAFLKAPAKDAFNPDVFRDAAMKGKGNAEHGRALFSDLKGLACIKCHAVGNEGGKVGPELASVSVKYPRAELIASVLFPSARVSSGYEPVVVAVSDGRVLTGILKSETPDALEIEDADAKHIRIPKADIDERKRSDVSLMPSGLAEGLSVSDFADLIAYLETLKETPKKP
jgi:putative heme-binding domain-containing protein